MAKSWAKLLAFNLGIAIAYSVAAQLSIAFATLPGKVTAVWLPSGMTLAFVAWLGKFAFPGIVLGSVVGLTPNLLTMNPPLPITHVVLLNLACAFANCIQPAVAIWLMRRLTGRAAAFNQLPFVISFILAALFAPSLSATLGITSLCLLQALHWKTYATCWLTWWLASVVAHLLFSPPLLIYPVRYRFNTRFRWWEMLLLPGLGLGLSWAAFIQNYRIEYTLIPVLIWSVFRLGNFFTSILVGIISAIAIVMTARGWGLAIADSPSGTLLLLQSFIAVCSVTTLVLAAVIQERKVAESALERTLASLEQQIAERTAELQESQAILDGFFSVAPVGMGIVDHTLRYVRINQLLSEMNGGSIEQYLGQKIREVLPDLSEEQEPIYQKVLETGQAILNQEESVVCLSNSKVEYTLLKSYFPILDREQRLSKVGVIALDISDRKRLETQLKRQARKDGLTAIPNRLQFQETSELEWRRCSRIQQAFSIILLDLDEFKRYNDTYGHLAGDTCLIQIASLLRTAVKRATDLVARYGGEEFIVLLPETDSVGAVHVANRIRCKIDRQQIPHRSSSVCPFVTASIGVATCIPNANSQISNLIQAADEALYESKRLGRDRITLKTLVLS
jgi:diguanylate cyclase (GGDEF)-like protein/PAS domain S-box-containing protein